MFKEVSMSEDKPPKLRQYLINFKGKLPTSPKNISPRANQIALTLLKTFVCVLP